MIHRYKAFFVISAVIVLLIASGCSSLSSSSKALAQKSPENIPDAVPKIEPRSRYGNPKWYVVFGKKYQVMDEAKGYTQEGTASWYGKKFHGRRTSSGETYDMYAMTAAHKSLPLPSYVRVTNLDNQRTAIVKVNDRGPFVGERIIDLSLSAAKKLGVVQKGTAPVRVEVIDPANYRVPVAAADDATNRVGQPAANEVGQPVSNNPIDITRDQDNADVLYTSPPPVILPGDTATSVPVPVTSARKESMIYLQAGAFSVDVNAQQLAQQIRSAQQSPVYVESGKDSLLRVLVGPFLTSEAADSVAEFLQAEQKIKAQIITKDYLVQ